MYRVIQITTNGIEMVYYILSMFWFTTFLGILCFDTFKSRHGLPLLICGLPLVRSCVLPLLMQYVLPLLRSWWSWGLPLLRSCVLPLLISCGFTTSFIMCFTTSHEVLPLDFSYHEVHHFSHVVYHFFYGLPLLLYHNVVLPLLKLWRCLPFLRSQWCSHIIWFTTSHIMCFYHFWSHDLVIPLLVSCGLPLLIWSQVFSCFSYYVVLQLFRSLGGFTTSQVMCFTTFHIMCFTTSHMMWFTTSHIVWFYHFSYHDWVYYFSGHPWFIIFKSKNFFHFLLCM